MSETTYNYYQELFLAATNWDVDFNALQEIPEGELKFTDEDWDLVYVERQWNALTYVHTIDRAEKWRSIRIQIQVTDVSASVTLYSETDWLTWEVFTHIW